MCVHFALTESTSIQDQTIFRGEFAFSLHLGWNLLLTGVIDTFVYTTLTRIKTTHYSAMYFHNGPTDQAGEDDDEVALGETYLGALL